MVLTSLNKTDENLISNYNNIEPMLSAFEKSPKKKISQSEEKNKVSQVNLLTGQITKKNYKRFVKNLNEKFNIIINKKDNEYSLYKKLTKFIQDYKKENPDVIIKNPSDFEDKDKDNGDYLYNVAVNAISRFDNIDYLHNSDTLTDIQSVIRGETVRKNFKELKKKNDAVKTIQAMLKGNKERNEFENIKESKKLLNDIIDIDLDTDIKLENDNALDDIVLRMNNNYKMVKYTFDDFDESVADYASSNDLKEQKNIIAESYDLIDKFQEYADKMDILVNDYYDKVIVEKDEEIKTIENLLVSVNEQFKINDFSKGATLVTSRDKLKKLFNISTKIPSNEDIGKEGSKLLTEKSKLLQNLETNKKNFIDNFGPNGNFVNLKRTFKTRLDDLKKYYNEKNPDKEEIKTKPKRNTYIPETIIKKDDEQIINETDKNDIVNLIVKQRPDISKDELSKMTKNELIEVVKITGINLQDLFSLKIPKNASKEQIELIQNLENIKRQRDVEDEVKKLKEKVRGSDAIALEEEKNKLLQKSFNIVKKGVRKPVGFKNVVKKKEPINKAIKKAVNAVDKQISVPKMNENQVLGLGIVNDKNKIERNLLDIMKGEKQDEQVMKRKKKVVRTLGGNNPYMNFMKQFREENKGKYSSADMMKVGAEAYRKLNKMPDKEYEQQKKVIKTAYNNNEDDAQMFNYASDFAHRMEQEHLSRDFTADNRIKKNVEKHNENIGQANLANAYRKFIKAQFSK